MVGFVLDLLAGLLPWLGSGQDSPHRAYRHAWKVAAREGTRDETTLRNAFRYGNVPGGDDPDADPVLSAYLERWRRRVHPRDVPRHER